MVELEHSEIGKKKNDEMKEILEIYIGRDDIEYIDFVYGDGTTSYIDMIELADLVISIIEDGAYTNES